MEAVSEVSSTPLVNKSVVAGDSPSEIHSVSTPATYENIKVIALCVIAILMISQALYVAAAVLIPLVFAFVFALALRPVVRKLKSYGIPAHVGAGLILLLAMLCVGTMASQLITPASEWLSQTTVESKLRELRRKLAPLEEPLKQVNDASQQVSDLAVQAGGADTEAQLQQVVLRPPSLFSEFLSSSWQVTAGFFLCFVTTYFFLAEGEKLLNEKPKVTSQYSPSINKYTTIIKDVEASVSTYLLTVSVINACLGVTVGISCWLLEVPNPMLWGFVAFVLNYLPYVGAIVGVLIISLVSLFSFDSISYAALAPAVYLALTSIEGYLITPSVLGRSMSLNPLIVILSLSYWSWLWGVSGAVLAVPLLAIFISLAKNLDITKPWAMMMCR